MIKLWRENEGFRLIIYVFVGFFTLAFILVKLEERYFPPPEPVSKFNPIFKV
jgi:hypothetical protein